MNKKAKAAGLACLIAAPCEGLRQVAYYDPVGILTVCRGHTGADIVKGKKYSLAECDSLLTDEMRGAVQTVDRCQPGLPVEVLAAFADKVYNSGPTIACNTENSTAARYLRDHKWHEACNQLPRWDKARVLGVMVSLPGLTKRALLQQELCLQGAG